jgi:hypothetical protein
MIETSADYRGFIFYATFAKKTIQPILKSLLRFTNTKEFKQ